MKRTQIYLDDGQWTRLGRAARRSHRTVSALIRQAIDAQLAAPPAQTEVLQALQQAFGLWKDRTDLGSTDSYVRRLRRGTRLQRLSR